MQLMEVTSVSFIFKQALQYKLLEITHVKYRKRTAPVSVWLWQKLVTSKQ